VLDYKTGGDSPYKKLSESEPHDCGKHLQLYVYGRAARLKFADAQSVRADYWFTKTNKLHGYPISDQIEEKVLAAIQSIADGIAAGVFPARPADRPTYGYVECWYCAPDGLSSEHVRRDWERKRLDPALSGYLALTEPGIAHADD
jgi:ATP-dependent helicase/nuclease subunit B